MSSRSFNAIEVFQSAAGTTSHRLAANDNKPAPFSLRLSAEERAWLDERARGRPLGAYIREKLLGDKAAKRRISRNPQIQEAQYAALLAALGESRLSSNLNQLAHHANMGTLDVSEDVEQQLQEAYQAILEMRKALFMALGLQVNDGL
jgi:hypothetical protein